MDENPNQVMEALQTSQYVKAISNISTIHGPPQVQHQLPSHHPPFNALFFEIRSSSQCFQCFPVQHMSLFQTSNLEAGIPAFLLRNSLSFPSICCWRCLLRLLTSSLKDGLRLILHCTMCCPSLSSFVICFQ